MMPRWACAKDANHDLICETLRKLGWDVIETWQVAQYVPGFPDAMACRDGVVIGIEIKGARGVRTKAEREFALAHDWMIPVVRTIEDCQKLTERRA